MTILLADSDRDLLKSYGTLLALDGHAVATAFDGAQVASLLPRGRYDMAILGKALPRVGHEQLLRLLQREDVPVIVLLEERVSAGRLLGEDLPEAFLPLPFLPGDLRALIRSVAEKRGAGKPFAFGDASVDAARFRFANTDMRLTAGEIDLIGALIREEPVQGRRARTIIQALNEKLRRLGRRARIEYEPRKGYRLVNGHE